MNKDDKMRLGELKGEQLRLQAQCYILKKALETNERQLDIIASVIAEHGAGEEKPKPGEKEREKSE